MLVLRLEGVVAVQVMGGDAIVCNHMQAQAASRATRVPTGQMGVTGGWTLLPSKELSARLVRLEDVIRYK